MGIIKNIDDKEIAFIVCTNDDNYMNECKYYIESLYVPENMKVSVIEIKDSVSMTSGYNRAMHSSKAKYKVYLHQDVFILYRNFINEVVDCFRKNETLGIIGIAGAKRIPDNGYIWDTLDSGGFSSIGTFSSIGYACLVSEGRREFEYVEYVDGMLIATQYDVDWDERIKGYHFYDASQCLRFKEKELGVATIAQDNPWILHDFGPLNVETYDDYRKCFCKLYGYEYMENEPSDTGNVWGMLNSISVTLKNLYNRGEYNKVNDILKDIGSGIYFHQDLLVLYYLMEIKILEDILGFESIKNDEYYEDVTVFHRIKWRLIRFEFNYESLKDTVEWLVINKISLISIIVVGLHNVSEKYYQILFDIGHEFEHIGYISKDSFDYYFDSVVRYEKEHVPLDI